MKIEVSLRWRRSGGFLGLIAEKGSARPCGADRYRLGSEEIDIGDAIGVTEEVARGREIKGEAVTGGADRGNQWSPAAPVGSKEQIEAGQGRGGHRRADRGHRRGLVAAA